MAQYKGPYGRYVHVVSPVLQMVTVIKYPNNYLIRKSYRFELSFFDGTVTVLSGKFCVGVPLNIQSIYPVYYLLHISCKVI